MASPQHITTRLATSEARFVTYPTPGAGAPNVVMVVLDDVGFAQLGPFGGGIATPNIDRLAAAGLRYNRFHVTSICSSTRAALLTGRNHHAVGMGLTQETVLGFPGYTGRIPQSAATLARILRDNGYNTMAVGKWHLAARGDPVDPGRIHAERGQCLARGVAIGFGADGIRLSLCSFPFGHTLVREQIRIRIRDAARIACRRVGLPEGADRGAEIRRLHMGQCLALRHMIAGLDQQLRDRA